MKFLCVPCDQPMTLMRTDDPGDGSFVVVFTCRQCRNEVAMLTNPWETQLVRALDVRLGGPGLARDPLQFVRSTLVTKREGLELDASPAAGTTPAPSCPFSSVVTPGPENPPPTWDPAAERRLERIPEFIRPMARQGIERFAAERGYLRITEEVMDEARGALGS